jgi:uncharacterized membrane protein YjfL (UPF0719 family)
MEPLRTGYVAAFGVGTSIVLLLFLRLWQRIMRPTHTVSKDLASGNAAWRLEQVGETVAVFLVASAVVQNCLTGQGLLRDIGVVAAFGLAGFLLVQGLGHVAARLLLRGKLKSELERGNAAAGLAAGMHDVAVGLLASKAIAGSNVRDLSLSVAFFAIGIVTHMAACALFRAVTTYDDEEQIHGENLAAAISYAGLTLAVAMVIARALEGDFESWGTSLKGYGLLALWVLALYPARQIVVQWLLLGTAPRLRGGAIDDRIASERDVGTATMEAGTYVAAAIAISRLA